MKRLLGRRLVVLLIVIVVMLFNLVPTFFPDMVPTEEERSSQKLPFYKDWLSEKKINLGLDLQGGLHLVLGLDLDQVMLDATEQLDRNIFEDLKETEKVTATSHGRLSTSTDPEVGRTHIQMQFKSSEDREKAEKFVARRYLNVEFIGRTDLGFRLRYDQRYRDFLKKRAVDQSIETIRNRIDEFGVREPSISRQGEDRLTVQFPGISDPERLKNLIGQTAKLEFLLVDDRVPQSDLDTWVEEAAKAGIKHVEGGKEPFSKYLRGIRDFLKDKIPANRTIAFQKNVDRNTKEVTRIPYLLETPAQLTGEHLEDAYVSYSQQFNDPEVNMSMTPQGAIVLAKLSGDNINRFMAIVLDGNIHSAPRLQSKIPNGQARITMGGGLSREQVEQDAQDTALVLRAGSLPTTLEFLEERTVGPSLGKDSIRQGAEAMKWGILFVILFMVVYYGVAGGIADLSLALNVLCILGLLAVMDATLTLPGIAGVILTVGMAVDANIIIYERIREELARRSTISAAIEEGYANALSTILDSNITTLISAFFLYEFGTGPIKGFAVTLSIGIFTTLFTALFVSRLLIDVYLKTTDGKKFSIGGHMKAAQGKGA